MRNTITPKDIKLIVELAQLNDYRGSYVELGGGEINDTFLLQCNSGKQILRMARYEDQESLACEARTLASIQVSGAPRLVFFDHNLRYKGKLWIVETYMRGKHVKRLDLMQFGKLGALLAKLHSQTAGREAAHPWNIFLTRRSKYGDEANLMNHEDSTLRLLMQKVRTYVYDTVSPTDKIPCSIVHGDATPTNILTYGKNVSLIDWEFSHLNDPMAEFSTIYYDDMEYNNGKWRIQISADERKALFAGYVEGGGAIDLSRIQLWMMLDKLGASLYLYWRMHNSGREVVPGHMELYARELDKLKESLQTYFK